MMSKYDHLDAYTELEQTITADLRTALEKRGCTITHHGNATGHAPAGQPDITITTSKIVITVEVTKLKGAAQDRELNAIRDHLNGIKQQNPGKKCYCLYSALTTPVRMRDGIRDHNQQRAAEGKPDLVMLPLSFENLELLLTRWTENDAALYPFATFLTLFGRHPEFVDDLRVRKLLVQKMFPQDSSLREEIEDREREADTKTLEDLIKDLTYLENTMRQNGIATAGSAINNLIFLVFLKVFEEKREREGQRNRLRSEQAFREYRNDVNPVAQREARAIHELFNNVKQTPEFQESGMFVATDTLANTLTDDFILRYFIPKMQTYTFSGTRVDALGAVYEVLALRAEKDVKAGQFFTPENVVRFMVQLADLRHDDRVLDPACGTGRFLIYAMEAMLQRLAHSDERNKSAKEQAIRQKQLFGSDIDEQVAKIAKMNM